MLKGLSPEQSKAIATVQGNDRTTIKYLDFNVATETTFKLIESYCHSGQKVLIHCTTTEQTNTLERELEKYGLGNFAVEIDCKQPLNENEVSHLRAIHKGAKTIESSLVYEQLLIDLAETEKGYGKTWNKVNENVFGEASVLDLLQSQIYGHNRNQNLFESVPSHQLVISVDEYYLLKNSIQKMLDIYQPQFDLLSVGDYLSANAKAKEATALKNKLQSFHKRVSALLAQFTKAKSAISTLQEQKVMEGHTALNNTIIELRKKAVEADLKASLQTDKKGLFNFKKQQEQANPFATIFDEFCAAVQLFDQTCYEAIAPVETASIDYRYLVAAMEDIQVPLQKALVQKLSQARKVGSNINKVNTQIGGLEELDNQLKSLLCDLNADEILAQHWENNTLVFTKQISLLEEVQEVIAKGIVYTKLPAEHHQYKQLLNKHSLLPHLFSLAVTDSEGTWKRAFENWYLNSIIAKNADTSLQIGLQQQAESLTLIEKIKSVSTSRLAEQLHEQRKAAIDTMKKNSSGLYSTLFKKKNRPNTSWHDVTLLNRDFAEDFYPIHWCTDLQFAENYDLLVTFSEPEDLPVKEVRTVALVPITRADFENPNQENTVFLYLNQYNYHGTIANLNNTEKIKAAKKLAKFILSLTTDVNIYQLKTANIISTLPINDNVKLEHELESFGVKKMDTDQALYDYLTESILDYARPQFLLLKDGLINRLQPEHSLWQLQVQNLLKEAGIVSMTFWSQEQFENNHEVFSAAVAKLTKGLSKNDSTEEENLPLVNDGLESASV